MNVNNADIDFEASVNPDNATVEDTNNAPVIDDQVADDTTNDTPVEEGDASQGENNNNDGSESDDNDGDQDETSIIDMVVTNLGININDEDGNPLSFEDTEEGLAAYLNAARQQLIVNAYDEVRNKVFDNEPVIKDAYNYLRLNGNLQGFLETPDRSNVVIDENNATQHETIVRELAAAKGQSVDEDYLTFLKENGKLFSKATADLEELKAIDSKRIADREAAVAAAEQQMIESNKQYWGSVKSSIDAGIIGDYKIGDTITVVKDGKQVVKTRNDFFKYMSAEVKDGKSQWHLDDEAMTDEEARNEEVLRAYLKFTGGSYNDLVKLAINKQQVADHKKKLGFTKQKNKVVESKNDPTATNDQIVFH